VAGLREQIAPFGHEHAVVGDLDRLGHLVRELDADRRAIARIHAASARR
jgi:hypothetical protein